jgi:hypothetical protein
MQDALDEQETRSIREWGLLLDEEQPPLRLQIAVAAGIGEARDARVTPSVFAGNRDVGDYGESHPTALPGIY